MQIIWNNKTLLTSAQKQLFKERFEIFGSTLKISLMKSEGVNSDILATAACLVLNKHKPDADAMKILKIQTPKHTKLQ